MKVILYVILMSFSHHVFSAAVDINGSHPVCSNLKYASRDVGHYADAYDDTYKQIAINSFMYALMASNSYEEYEGGKPKFHTNDWELIEKKTSTWKGMGAHVYRSNLDNKDIVIAFEGTNPLSINDWLFGNLNIFWKGQYSDAEELIDRIAKQYPDTNIITTGHSLGGGLAIHAALYRGNTKAYAFNSSPRIFIPDDIENINGVDITVISENNDILKFFREKLRAFKNIKLTGPYNKFDFLSETALNEHSIYFIARGLTIVAASAGDIVAEITMWSYPLDETICPT